MRLAKKIIKWVLLLILFLIIAGWISLKVMSETRPETNQSKEADQLAMEMFTAMNKPAWDSLRYLKWEFMRGHKYLWDKQGNNAVIKWENNEVILNLDKVAGRAFVSGSEVKGEEYEKLKEAAWTMWCNDSFWMFAPFKAFDKGTARTVVKSDDGSDHLMVSYESGGVTPGDAYLWEFGKDGLPSGYKMWTFIPLKGMYMSWENWKTLKGGAKVATSHKSKLLSFDMKDVLEGDSPSELGYEDKIFSKIE